MCFFQWQVAAQIERDRLQKENEERQLRLQEETRKHNELLNSRKLLRNEEVLELKMMQQNHMEELNARIKEGDNIYKKNVQLQSKRTHVEEELARFTANLRERSAVENAVSHNLSRLKMQMRQRSDAVRRDIAYDIELLKRLATGEQDDREALDLLR